MLAGVEAELHPLVVDMKQRMSLAKMYNHYTGANITHMDTEEWGILEEASILAVIDLMSDGK